MISLQNTADKIHNRLSPELQLLLLCSKFQVQEKEQKTIERLVVGPIEWNLFLRLVLQHRVFPLVYRYLNCHKDLAVPEHVRLSLRQVCKENISKTLCMTAELMKLLRAMEGQGIPVLVMKGIPLAYYLYKDITLRPSSDLDILVSPENVNKAWKIIEEYNYAPVHPVTHTTSSQLDKWMEANQHLAFWHDGQETYLEVHWRLSYYGWDTLLTSGTGIGEIQVAGQAMQVMEKEVLILYLILHGAFHAWAQLRWLQDIDNLVRKNEFSWDVLYQLAEQMHVRHILNQSIYLIEELWETHIPESVWEKVMHDKKALRLSDMVMPFICDHDHYQKTNRQVASLFLQQKKYLFCLQPSWREKLIFIWRCFLPAKEDHELIVFPRKLYFMYYILSPLTSIGRRIRNFSRRAKLH